MSAVNILELNSIDTKKILNRLSEWRNGICPNGQLAKESCFVLEHRPTITIHPDQSKQVVTTELITEKEWSDNLIDCGAITHLNDDILMRTLSDFYMIFHSKKDKSTNVNTLHLIHLLKHGSFKVDNILRPTKILQQKLKELILIEDLEDKWNYLLNIWNTFGYFWPRKIIIGYKTHLKQSYKFMDNFDNMNGYYYTLNKLKDKFSTTKEEFNIENFLNECEIISRIDLTPMHEFLNLELKNKINTMIYTKFIQIPVYYPIKIYNVITNSYLCWDPYTNSNGDPSFDGDSHDYLINSIDKDPLELSRSPDSQYLWRMTWRPIQNNDNFEDHRPQTIRGCSKVYIYPACKSISPSIIKQKKLTIDIIQDKIINNLINTHQMVLSCRPYRYELLKLNQSEFSKLRPLRLLSNNSTDYINEKIDWTIEYPNNGLKYMTDAQANIKLNFHEHIRRLKPILIGDTIQLQQIGLLTSFNPICKLTDPLQPSFKKTSIIAKKPKNKKSVLCIDEDITLNNWRENTFWKIELATKADINRHSSQFIRSPQSNPQYNNMNSLLNSIHIKEDNLSINSTTTNSIRKSKSLDSLNPTIHLGNDSEKAPYFVNLVNNNKSNNIISQIAKVSLQPLTQLVKTSKSKKN